MRVLFTGDWHLRRDIPFCRDHSDEEEWIEIQKNQILRVFKIANQNNANVVHTGDIFNSSNVHPSVLNMFLDCLDVLNQDFYYVIGNHDLLFHNLNNLKNSSIYALKKHPKCHNLEKTPLICSDWVVIRGLNYSSILDLENYPYKDTKELNKKTILVTHNYILPDNFLNQEKYLNITPYSKLKDYFTGIISGHYHSYAKSTFTKDNHFLINTGCLNIQTISQIGFIPKVFLLHLSNFKESVFTIEEIEIPDIEFKPFTIQKENNNVEFSEFITSLKEVQNNGKKFDIESAILKELSDEEKTIFYRILEKAKKLKEAENE